MTDLRLDPTTGNLDLTGGELQLVDGVEAIAQHIRIRLRTFLGTWFLDRRVGVPYYEQVLVKNPQTNIIRRILEQVVRETPGVDDVQDFELDYDGATRVATVTFNATVNGDELLGFTVPLIVRI